MLPWQCYFLRGIWPKSDVRKWFLRHIVRNRLQNHFLRQKKESASNLNPCVKFGLNSSRNKKAMENLIFDETSDLKLKMTSYSDNAYDVTNFFVVLKSSWHLFYSCQVSFLSDPKCGRVKPGGFLPPPPPIHYRGIPDHIENRVNH